MEVIYLELNKKLTIRVPEEWHRKIKAEAALRGLKLSQLVRNAVDDWLSQNPLDKEVNNE